MASQRRSDGSNPKLFRELSEPFPNVDVAEAAIEEFITGLSVLREKCRIKNVYVVMQFGVIDSQGEEGERLTTAMYGDGSMAEAMAAYGYGHEAAARREHIARILKLVGATKVEG